MFICLFIDLFVFCFNHSGTPTESSPENFVKIQLDLAEILRTRSSGLYALLLLPCFPSPPRQSNLLILNISAKSSQIFTKFSVELSVGVPLWLKQKTNKSYKQTNKQTNKWTFLDPISLSWIKLDLHKIFSGAFCGCPTMIKTKQTNKDINKQTNKQINIF